MQFVADGAVNLPNFDGGERTLIEPSLPYTRRLEDIDTSVCPPNGGWHYRGMIHTSLPSMTQMAKRAGHGDNLLELRLDIIRENIKRRPDFFSDDSLLHTLTLYRSAMAQQGLSDKIPLQANHIS